MFFPKICWQYWFFQQCAAIMFFPRMYCQSFLLQEFAFNYLFFQNVLPIMFFP
jgi:hypothetical protein